jgi:UDP-N-acetylglucosamine:LPS N-acetylglucosamine transferase
LESLDKILEKYFVVWSVGKNNYIFIKNKILNKDNIKLFSFMDEKELAAAYILCDVAIGRAGTGTIFETAAFGKPSILIPLERKGGDQPHNAQAYANVGATLILKESELSQENLLAKITETLNQSQQLSQNAKKFARIDAATELAKILIDLANSNSKH